MPRDKKYTKTVAMRLTEAEWQIVTERIAKDGHKNPTELFRAWLAPHLAGTND